MSPSVEVLVVDDSVDVPSHGDPVGPPGVEGEPGVPDEGENGGENGGDENGSEEGNEEAPQEKYTGGPIPRP